MLSRRTLLPPAVVLFVAAVMVGGRLPTLAARSATEARRPDAAPRVLSRAFEFRAVSADARADGETDFKGPTSVLSTEERVAFLTAYADFASAWFGDPKLDHLAATPAEAAQRLAQVKPQPLPSVRRTIRLDEGWKQTAANAGETPAPARPWRTRPGVLLKPGELVLPPGSTEIVDLSVASGWRYELRWDAKAGTPTSRVRWTFGQAQPPDAASGMPAGWHRFRLQADLVDRRGYLSRDGARICDFPLQQSPGASAPFSVTSPVAIAIRDLVFIDYRPTSDPRRPFEPVALARDDFRARPSMTGWNQPSYDDSLWRQATLPCVHGGFLEAEEDLYLRRWVELPAAGRVVLELEALDPSGEIYVNGRLFAPVANRLPVRLDITSVVKAGSNLIAIKIDHNRIEDPVFHAPIDPATGWFAGRAVLHLVPADVVIRECLVDTASIGERRDARQTHHVQIENTGSQPFDGTLDIAYRPWYPAEGAQVARDAVAIRIPAHNGIGISTDVRVPSATLWTPEQPQLYAVTATVRDLRGRAVDQVVTTTGVRTVAQKDGQLLLNGAPVLLIGAQNMGMRPFPDFENAAKYNRAAPATALIAEMLAVKKMGGNLLRIHVHSANNTTGGINDPRIAEMADQLGLALFWTGPAWIREGDERSIDTAHVGDYMRQVYNHPSIVNWELSNHPNTFKKDDSPQRTHDFVARTVQAVLAYDTSRLITPTTYWEQTHYGNDLGTIDWKQRPITAVPEYTHPLVTRGTQDSITGYGAEWSKLRLWPVGLAADTLGNGIRAWFNFEHEESAGQPNWNLSAGWPWHHLRSYEAPYEQGSIGRVLAFDEWRASQAWQAFSAYESMRKQIWRGVAGFSWCTIEGGANSGTYEKPLLDPMGHAKLAWYIHKMLTQPVLAGSDNVDTMYGPGDAITPSVFNLGPARVVDLTMTVKTTDGKVVDERRFPELRLASGRSVLKLSPLRPKLPASGFCVVEYVVTDRARGTR